MIKFKCAGWIFLIIHFKIISRLEQVTFDINYARDTETPRFIGTWVIKPAVFGACDTSTNFIKMVREKDFIYDM